MAAELQCPVSVAPVIPSRLVLTQRKLRFLALVEDYDGLWDRVNRVCDQYMPELLDSQLRPS